jgi:cation:H+ antiporter
VVIGSNVFNLAALLGLGAVVAGRIALHRKVVLLGGTVAVAVAGVCLAVVLGVVPPAAGCLLGLAVVALYAVALGASARCLARLRLPWPWVRWLRSAVAEEEAELQPAIRPAPARWPDVLLAGGSLVIVVAASVAMERAAAALGTRFAVPEIVMGGLVLAAVTSLPNAVAAVYLAARGRGAATLSTALNSNTINVAIGLLVPAALIGLGRPSGQTILAAAWYIALTAAVLGVAYRDHGIGRATGLLAIGAYLVFAGSILSLAYAGPQAAPIAIMAGLAVAAAFAARLALRHHRHASNHQPGHTPRQPARPGTGEQVRGNPAGASANGNGPHIAGARMSAPAESRAGRESLLAGWPVSRLWVLGLAASLTVAATDAALGNRAVLIGLLIVGPCCVLLTGRWVPTGLTGACVTALAVVLGVPDGIWGTAIFFTWLTAVAVVALAATAAAAFVQALGPVRLR